MSSQDHDVYAFDADRRTWLRYDTAHTDGADPVPVPRGVLTTERGVLDEASRDLGRIAFQRPGSVLRPRSAEDVEAMVAFCGRHGIPVSARGEAHTTGGQSLNHGGLIIDMRGLDRIHSIGWDEVDADAGVTWLKLARAVADQGLRLVGGLTDYLRMSLGGVLSVGGFTMDYRHGGQVDAVRALEIVTPAGGRVWCSENEQPDLFDGALAGLGQLGIITRVRIAVEPAPRTVRTYHVDYTDPVRFFSDSNLVLERGEADEISASVVPVLGVPPIYRLSVSTFDDRAPDVLRGIGAAQTEAIARPYLQHVESTTRIIDVEREISGWDEWQKPWYDVVLPDTVVQEFVSAVIPSLTVEDRTGWVVLYPHRASAFHRPMLRIPAPARWVWVLGVLTVAGPAPAEGFAARMLDRNRRLEARAQALGGLRYPIGASDWSQVWWREHYGPVWPRLVELKKRHDPDAIMTRGVGIFPWKFEQLPTR